MLNGVTVRLILWRCRWLNKMSEAYTDPCIPTFIGPICWAVLCLGVQCVVLRESLLNSHNGTC